MQCTFLLVCACFTQLSLSNLSKFYQKPWFMMKIQLGWPLCLIVGDPFCPRLLNSCSAGDPPRIPGGIQGVQTLTDVVGGADLDVPCPCVTDARLWGVTLSNKLYVRDLGGHQTSHARWKSNQPKKRKIQEGFWLNNLNLSVIFVRRCVRPARLGHWIHEMRSWWSWWKVRPNRRPCPRCHARKNGRCQSELCWVRYCTKKLNMFCLKLACSIPIFDVCIAVYIALVARDAIVKMMQSHKVFWLTFTAGMWHAMKKHLLVKQTTHFANGSGPRVKPYLSPRLFNPNYSLTISLYQTQVGVLHELSRWIGSRAAW